MWYWVIISSIWLYESRKGCKTCRCYTPKIYIKHEEVRKTHMLIKAEENYLKAILFSKGNYVSFSITCVSQVSNFYIFMV